MQPAAQAMRCRLLYLSKVFYLSSGFYKKIFKKFTLFVKKYLIFFPLCAKLDKVDYAKRSKPGIGRPPLTTYWKGRFLWLVYLELTASAASREQN